GSRAGPFKDGTSNEKLASRILNLADDPDPRVRFQTALTLGELQSAEAVSALAKIAERGMTDRWTRAAVLSAVHGRANDLLDALLPVAKKLSQGTNTLATLPLMNELGRVLGADRTN